MKRVMTLASAGLLALSGTAVAAGAGFASGTYNGKTDQGGPIKLVVAKKTLKSVHYKAAFSCKDQNGNTVGQTVATTDLPSTPIKGGKVSKLYKLGGGTDDIKFSVKLKGHKATGSFHELFISQNQDICDSGVVKFTAKR